MQTAKEYLREIETFQIWIEHCKANVRRLRKDMDDINESLSGIKAITYDGISVQTSPINTQEDRIIRAADRELKIQKRIDRQLGKIDNYQAEIDRRTDQIEQMRGIYSRILYERYVTGRTFEDIAAGIPMSYDRAIHLHGEALLVFTAKFLTKS